MSKGKSTRAPTQIELGIYAAVIGCLLMAVGLGSGLLITLIGVCLILLKTWDQIPTDLWSRDDRHCVPYTRSDVVVVSEPPAQQKDRPAEPKQADKDGNSTDNKSIEMPF